MFIHLLSFHILCITKPVIIFKILLTYKLLHIGGYMFNKIQKDNSSNKIRMCLM